MLALCSSCSLGAVTAKERWATQPFSCPARSREVSSSSRAAHLGREVWCPAGLSCCRLQCPPVVPSEWHVPRLFLSPDHPGALSVQHCIPPGNYQPAASHSIQHPFVISVPSRPVSHFVPHPIASSISPGDAGTAGTAASLPYAGAQPHTQPSPSPSRVWRLGQRCASS